MVAEGFNPRIQWTPALKGWATISSVYTDLISTTGSTLLTKR